jgi:hypothetical protein
MAYEPTIWTNREVERPRTFTMQTNADGTVTLIPAEGTVIEGGTPIVAENMNKIENGIVNLENTVDTNKDILDQAQLTKITADTGGQKLNIHDTATSLLTELTNEGTGFHTFYAASGVQDVPEGKSVRGYAHFTSDTFGYVQCQNYEGTMFTNYCDNLVWRGWKRLYNKDEVTNYKHFQASLWDGASYLNASAVIKPTKKLTECRNGWVLIWSDYNAGEGENEWDYNYTFIPRGAATYANAKSHMFSIPLYADLTNNAFINKIVNVSDTQLTGVANNEATNDQKDVCLRRVIEF